jgi:fatty-acyl-CoA synthase
MTASFPHRLWQLTQEIPDRICIHFQQAGKDDLNITYQQLYIRAAAYAACLARNKIQPGEVVILIFDYCPDLLYAFWGSVLQGAVPSILPFLTEKLNPDRYHVDLKSLISVTRPAAVITYPEFKEIAEKAAGGGTSVRSIIYSDRIPEPPRNPTRRFAGFERSPEDIVLLQHSSGTTGLQKGVALSHQSVFNQIHALSKTIALDQNKDRIASWLPLYHDMGLIAGFIMPVLSGVPLVLMSPFDWVKAPQRLLQAVSDYRCTLTWLPNFAYNFCAQKVRDRHLEYVDLSCWRAVINCSEPVRPHSHRAFYSRFKEHGLVESALQTSYAMAESTFGVTQSTLGQLPCVRTVDQETFLQDGLARPERDGRPTLDLMSSGRPLPNTEIRIQDAQGGIVGEDAVGEIALRSDCMLSEYFNRPEITQKSFQDGWFLTGDYGFLSEGEIYVTGRKKDLIIVGGKNIYPGDLEELLYELPGIHPGRAVVFGLFNENLGTEDVVILAESDYHNPVDRDTLADEIRRHVTQNSPVSLRKVEIVPPMWLIKTSSGKISRSANKQKYLAEFKPDQATDGGAES